MAYKRKKPIDMSGLSLDKQKEKAISYLFWYLGRQMETELVLRRKLQEKKYDQNVIDYAIDYFLESGYINDQEFVQSFMDSSRKDTLGRSSLRRKLHEKGISTELIEEALENIDNETEEENAYNVALKKAFTFDEELPYEKKLNRLVGFLARRGFPGNIIFSTAKQVIEDAETNGEGN